MKRQFMVRFFPLVLLIPLLLAGCSASGEKTSAGTDSGSILRNSDPQVLVPSADGVTTYSNDLAAIDASHSSEGYVMAKYTGLTEKVKLQLTGPDGNIYTFLLPAGGEFQTFPFTAGDGSYKIDVYECVSLEADLYALVFSQNLSVTLTDEFKPFLYANQYVNFSADSLTVAKGQSLASDCYTDLDVVSNVYHYITDNITYDNYKASSVTYGYLPVIDETLKSNTGICFDYASLMAAMLRSQGIPTKLQVGYTGEVYHAWISTYITDVGWIDKIIEFDGTSWTLMDPTLGAGNDPAKLKEYIGDGSIYQLQYSY